jgi:adenosylhomocysteine nucleosidase
MTEAPIGLLCAIPQERAHLETLLADAQHDEHLGQRFASGRLDGRAVVLAECGVGKVNAALLATLLLQAHGCGAVIFSGVAGGLDPDLHVGDVVIGREAVQYDAGVLTRERIAPYQAGHIPFFNPTDAFGFAPPADWLARIETGLPGLVLDDVPPAVTGDAARRPNVVFGRILTGDAFVSCTATRERLHAELGGQAVEMEGAAVAQVAQRYDAPALVVRALSDLAGAESHLDFGSFLKVAAANAAAVVRLALREAP